MVRTLVFASVLGLLGFVGVGLVRADDKHHNGHALLQKNLSKDGRHMLHQSGSHVAHAHVKNGKVKRVEVAHKGKSLQVKKFKTSQKRHAMADVPGKAQMVFADAEQPADTVLTSSLTVYIGFGYYNEYLGQWIIFWFPIELVDGGDDGAADYDGMT